MERPTGDVTTGGSLVPASASLVPATEAFATFSDLGCCCNPSVSHPKHGGATPHAYDGGSGHVRSARPGVLPVCTEILLFLDESNIDQARREAEERHTQLMEQMVQQLRSDFEAKSVQMHQTCRSELLQQRAESAQRHERDAAEMSTCSRALSPSRRSSILDVNLPRQTPGLKNTLRISLETECKKVVDDTISYAQSGMEGFRREESVAMTELREECKRQENQAAELNAQLQDRVDELMEKLNKYSAPMLNIEELGQEEEGIPAEAYPTPRAEHATTAGVEPEPHEAMSDLAGHAKERLQS